MTSETIDRDVAVSRSGVVYQRRGQGRPVVLVHGWCLDRTVWMYQEQALVEAGFEVISPDLAGFGESRGLSGPFGLDRHGHDLADLLEELGLADAILVGFAFGAAVSLCMPNYERVGGIVSIGIPSAAGAPYDKMRVAMFRDWPKFAHRSAAAICAGEHSDDSISWLGDVFARTPLNSAVAGVDVLSAFEPLELDGGGRPRLLLVHGADDQIVSAEVSVAAASHFADAASAVIADCGHFVPWDQPSQLSQIIIEFARAELG